MAAVLPPQPLRAKPPDGPPPLVVKGMHASAAAREATTVLTGHSPHSTAHEPAFNAASPGRSSGGDVGRCSAPDGWHADHAAHGEPDQERCVGTDTSGREATGMACGRNEARAGTTTTGLLLAGEPDQASGSGADHLAPEVWDIAVGDDPAVTRLLTQRFMPHRQIAAICANGSITIWREDGGCRFTFLAERLPTDVLTLPFLTRRYKRTGCSSGFQSGA